MIEGIWRRLRAPGDDRAIVAAIVAVGIAIRVGLNALRSTRSAAGEALNVAIAIANGRGVADAYGMGTGPTAHFYPLMPGLGGALYGVFGVRSLMAEIILATWSISLSLGTYLVVMRTFERLGTPRGARLAALAFACVAPTYIGQEAVDFRLWDGGLTALLMAVQLHYTVALELGDGVRRNRPAILIGCCCAALLVLNPPAGIAAGVCGATVALRRLTVRRTATMAAAGAALMILLLTPWIIRNYQVFGAFVPTRSNAGLELAIGMDPASLNTGDRLQPFLVRMEALHPIGVPGHRALVAAGGEIAYSKSLLRQTVAWMGAHPVDTVRLLALHLRQQFLPEPWQFSVFGQASISPVLRSFLAGAVNIVGLLGVVWAVARRRPGWLYVLTLIAILSATTLPFQPVKRYTFLYYPFLIFAAADLLARFRPARLAPGRGGAEAGARGGAHDRR